MKDFNAQPVINILTELTNGVQFDDEQIDEAIDTLDGIKASIDIEDDETIDKIDEIQDYLQYLLTIEEPSMDEVVEEITTMISDLRQYAK